MNEKDWQELVERIHSEETQAVVARYAEEPEAEEPVQAALREEELT